MSDAEALSRLHRLKAVIRDRADEIEQARRVPPDLVDALEEAGCYRMFPPVWMCEGPPDYQGVLRVIEELAEADGSIGWSVSQTALAQVILGYLPRATLETVYAAGPDLRAAGVFAPKGRAWRSETGWRISGRWPFTTGCQFAAWIYVQSVVFENRRVVRTADDLPRTRLALFRAEDVEILDTWNALGLRGTGSHDVRVHNKNCTEAWTCALAEVDGTGEGVQAVPLLDHAGLFIAAVAVGIANGALREVAGLARSGKRPTFSPRRLAEDPVFHDRLGEAHMRARAARALLYAQARLVQLAIEGVSSTDVDRASLRATCHTVTRLAVKSVDRCHDLARSSSVPQISALSRRLRDIHTATQHAWNSADALQNLGRCLLDATSL